MAANEVSGAMTNRGGCSPRMQHGAVLVHYTHTCGTTAWLQRWLARGDGDGVAAHRPPLPCHVRGMGAPRGRQLTCFLVGMLLG